MNDNSIKLDATDIETLGLVTTKDLAEAVFRLEHIFKFHDRRINSLSDKLYALEPMIISVSNRLDFINGQAVDEVLDVSSKDLEARIRKLEDLHKEILPDFMQKPLKQEKQDIELTEQQIYLAGFHDAWVQLRPGNWKQDQINNAEFTYKQWAEYDKPKLKKG